MERTAIVTGGTGGLGAAVTRTLIDDGWRVVVPWYDERELARVDENERLDLVQADLTDPGSAAEVVARAGDGLGALVNLVGGFAQGERVHETPVDDFERLIRLNLRPTYLMSAAALPVMLRGGGGAIVCVSARAAVRPFPARAGTSPPRRPSSRSSTSSTPSTAATASARTPSCPRSSTRPPTARVSRTPTTTRGSGRRTSRGSSPTSAPTTRA